MGAKGKIVVLVFLIITVMGVGVGTLSAMKRDVGFEASWVGPSAEGVAHLMVFPTDIDNFDVDLAEEFVPMAAADGTGYLV